MESRKVEKNLKHHGWGLHGGTWKMGGWGRNIALEMLTCFGGKCFGGLGCLGIKTRVGLPIET
jgi:hypothetical protein